MYDLKKVNKLLQDIATIKKEPKVNDAKPVFANASANLGGMKNDKENNIFLRFYHTIGKDVENVEEWASTHAERITSQEGETAFHAIYMQALVLVHAATTAYAARGADIEHDKDAWTELETLIAKVEDFEKIVKGPATPSPLPPPTAEIVEEEVPVIDHDALAKQVLEQAQTQEQTHE